MRVKKITIDNLILSEELIFFNEIIRLLVLLFPAPHVEKVSLLNQNVNAA